MQKLCQFFGTLWRKARHSSLPSHILPKHTLPQHVAIIMDGNSRWAKLVGKPAIYGHQKGADAAYNAVKFASEIGIEYLTLFAFSSENWARPAHEVSELMDLLRHYLKVQVSKLVENNIRLRIIGDRQRLAPDVQEMIHIAEEKTSQQTKMTLIMAISYGGRDEIMRVCKEISLQVQEKRLKVGDINESLISDHLDTAGIPDPDLLIRTSGEYRISNFLCWQLAYTELYFTQNLWPDFTRETFANALEDYARRERRFGGVSVHVT